MEELRTIGLKIQMYRKLRNVSAEQLAAVLGKSQNYILNIERGKADLRLLDFLLLCRFLDISPGKILEN